MSLVFTQILDQLNSSVFILIIVLFSLFFIVYKLGKYTERFTSFEEQLKKIDNFQDKASQSLQHLIAKMDIVYSNTIKNPTVQSNSPLGLTENGLNISKELDIKNMLNKVIDDNHIMLKKIYSNQNAYDIQNNSMKWAKTRLKDFLNDNEIEDIKNKAYHQGILDEDIYGIFGIELRDKILKELNMPTSEIDKHDTSKNKIIN